MADVRASTDYNLETVSSSLSALVELFTVLGSYRGRMVLVGGWAPYFLLKEHRHRVDDFRHVGSIDTDLVLDPAIADEDTYGSIVELIQARGYVMRTGRTGEPIPWSFAKAFTRKGREIPVQVDFMVPRAAKDDRRRTGRVQPDLRARLTAGAEIVFKDRFRRRITADLPGGGKKTVDVWVAGLASILALKGRALGERFKEKDAYDIYAVVAHCEGGPGFAAEAVKPYLGEAAVKDGLARIREAFSDRTANGPAWVANFLGAVEGRARERALTDAYMSVHEFLERVRRRNS